MCFVRIDLDLKRLHLVVETVGADADRPARPGRRIEELGQIARDPVGAVVAGEDRGDGVGILRERGAELALVEVDRPVALSREADSREVDESGRALDRRREQVVQPARDATRGRVAGEAAERERVLRRSP